MSQSPVVADAVLQDEEGRSILRFERTLRHSPERVWEALTDAGELASWHPTPFELERFVGGAVTFLPEGDAPDMPPGEVREYEPPRVLAWWHVCLMALEAALEGRKAPGTREGERIPHHWPELNSAYEQRFGIPHEQATPPPEL
jgi:uncharacterized protein YndB with AHSA1/START domain